MEFKQITINNFLSYYKNEIEFSPMTTIFIGQNNTGKSKLFDAINFAIYARVFDTAKELWLEDDKEIAALILNKHKINEALKNNESVINVSVLLLIDDVSENDILLQIERTFTFKLLENTFVYSSKNLNITEIDKFDGSAKSYLGSDAEERMNIYFPKSIKDFFLFQGEAASKIMQLQKGGNFRRAVKEIARLEIFEKAKDYAEKYEGTISRSLTMKANKNKQQKQKHEEVQREIDYLEEQVKKYQTKRDKAEKDGAGYSLILEKNNAELSKLKEFEDYFNQKKTLEENRKKIKFELSKLNNEKSVIAEDAVFYKIREKIFSFSNFYSSLEKKGEVPPSISKHEILKALDCCRCTICNTDLSEGTEARKFAESRLPNCDTDKLGEYLRELNYVLGDQGESVKKIPENLQTLLEKKREIEIRKQSFIKDDEYLAEMLEKTQIDENSPEEKIKNIQKIKQTISHYTGLLVSAEADKNSAEGSMNVISNQIFQKKKEMESLITEDEDIDAEDKIKLHFASKLNLAMNKLFEIANKTAYEQVEKRANEYYKEMTKENAALVGDIKIDLETSEIYTVDEDGYKIMNINQGNRISIQLAVIAGILTVAEEQFGVQYPFVTDAPVSHLGGDNKKSTIETMINAFEQSILVIKDDTSTKNKENDEIRKLISESSDIEMAYELSISKAENINDQYTVVKKIKG